LKQEQKAKEKAEKEKTLLETQSTKKKETNSVVKEEEISPNVSQVSARYSRQHSGLDIVFQSGEC
jgi:hypothetical protein